MAALRQPHRQYRAGAGLDDLAHDLQRDKYYLAHLYKQETGQTINQYENSYRISRFKSMLLWTDQPITEMPSLALQPQTMPRAALKKSSVLRRISTARATS